MLGLRRLCCPIYASYVYYCGTQVVQSDLWGSSLVHGSRQNSRFVCAHFYKWQGPLRPLNLSGILSNQRLAKRCRRFRVHVKSELRIPLNLILMAVHNSVQLVVVSLFCSFEGCALYSLVNTSYHVTLFTSVKTKFYKFEVYFW